MTRAAAETENDLDLSADENSQLLIPTRKGIRGKRSARKGEGGERVASTVAGVAGSPLLLHGFEKKREGKGGVSSPYKEKHYPCLFAGEESRMKGGLKRLIRQSQGGKIAEVNLTESGFCSSEPYRKVASKRQKQGKGGR